MIKEMNNKTIKILNLYACLGGNRYKWNEVYNNIEVTAVELDPELARLYQERFPNDRVIIADAHEYLLNHYKEFDFIWSSPPCPSHSRARFARHKSIKSEYMDFNLYQEIVFLKYYFKGKYVVENVIPFYQPLIEGKKRDRHLYWTNFNLPSKLTDRKAPNMEKNGSIKNWSNFHEYDFKKYKGDQRINKIARNLVDFEAGKTIFAAALNMLTKKETKQIQLL